MYTSNREKRKKVLDAIGIILIILSLAGFAWYAAWDWDRTDKLTRAMAADHIQEECGVSLSFEDITVVGYGIDGIYVTAPVDEGCRELNDGQVHTWVLK